MPAPLSAIHPSPVPRWLYLLRLLPFTLRGKGRIARGLLKLAALQGPVEIEVEGFKLWAPSAKEPVAIHLITDGLYDPDTCAVLKQALRKDSVLLDVGANIGVMSITASRQWCPEGRIVSFEASPGVYGYLSRNVKANMLENITLMHRAVSNRTGLALKFYEAPDAKFGMGSLANRFGTQETEVPTITLDDAARDLGIAHVDVIKVDVEGFELEVFQGSQRLLEQDPAPVIVFEFNDWAETRGGSSRAGDAQRFLRSKGYSIIPIKKYLRGDLTEPAVLECGSCDFVALRHKSS